MSDLENALNNLSGMFVLAQQKADLEAENARLRQQVAELEAELLQNVQQLATCKQSLQVHEDTKRLDWLIERSNSGDDWLHESVWDRVVHRQMYDTWEHDDSDMEYWVREIIDAAMKEGE